MWSTAAGGFGVDVIAAKRLFFVLSGVAALVGILVVIVRYPESVPPTLPPRPCGGQ